MPYIRAVIDALDAGGEPPTGPEEARRSLELCVGLYTSALTGKPTSLPIGEDNPYYGGISREEFANLRRNRLETRASTFENNQPVRQQ